MIYLSSFALSDKKVKNPNLYPYSVFQDMDCDPFVFAPITILYGDNGCGKSTLLNIIAQKINAKGYETYAYGQYYIQNYVEECRFDTGEDDTGRNLSIPAGSLYMKSEDVLYEIKKIQQAEERTAQRRGTGNVSQHKWKVMVHNADSEICPGEIFKW